MLISEAFPMAALIGMCLQAIKLNDRAFIMMKPFVVRGHACLLKTERERERDGKRQKLGFLLMQIGNPEWTCFKFQNKSNKTLIHQRGVD